MGAIVDPKLSLFEYVNHLNARPLFANYRGSMTVISHQIEDAIISGGYRARVFAGFQTLRYFLPQADRYRRLARCAEHIWIFAIPDVTPPPINNVTYVYLESFDRLANEWFLVADSPDYFSALIAEDATGRDAPQHKRLFRGLWTFNLEMVSTLRRLLSQAVNAPPFPADHVPRNYTRHMESIEQTVQKLVEVLEQNINDLRQAQQLRRDLTDMLVHDLRNPLTAVINNLDLAKRLYSDGAMEEVEEFIDGAHESSLDLKRLIADILDISRMEAGEFKIDLEPVRVRSVFDAIHKLYQGASVLERKTLTVQADSALGVYSDREMLIRILANLVGNAFKYTRVGRGEITVSAALTPARMVEITVADNGIGIPKAQQERIFEKFGQVRGRGNERRGFGLGLAFCRMSVQAQGGSIRVESEEGQGSRFIVTLRAAPVTAVTE